MYILFQKVWYHFRYTECLKKFDILDIVIKKSKIN